MSQGATDGATQSDVVLLNMLNNEVERLKLTEKLQLEGIERVDRDNKRQSVLLSLTQHQIELVKDANVRLQEQLMERDAQLTAATVANGELQDDLRRTQETLRSVRMSSSARVEELERAAIADAQTLDDLRTAGRAAAAEIQSLQEQLAAEKKDHEKASRRAFEHRVHVETRLQQKTTELQQTEELRTKDSRETLAREYQLSKSLTETKRLLGDVQRDYDGDKRKHFELCSTLKADSEGLQLRIARMDKDGRAREQELVVAVERLKVDLRMTQELLEEQRTSAQARERALETQQQKLVTDLRSAQAEVNSLVEKEVSHHRERIETVVSLNARNDALKQHVARLEDDLQGAKERLRIAVVESAGDREALRAQHGAHSEGLATKLESKSRELLAATAEGCQGQARLQAFEQELSNQKLIAQRNNDAQTAEIASYRAEVDGYKKAVAKLEQHIEDSYELKLMTEQNVQLQAEVTLLKQRLTNANSAFANLRIEADISDNYRASLLQERIEQQLKRAASLEAERQATRPLVDTLVDVVQSKGLSDPALDRDIEAYIRQFGKPAAKTIKAAAR